MRGEHAPPQPPDATAPGSAPRARGTPPPVRLEVALVRISPACAGNTEPDVELESAIADQPRVRGEHLNAMVFVGAAIGSAPRARGTLDHQNHRPRQHRISPACAGNTPRKTRTATIPPDQPRVRGEHSRARVDSRIAFGSAPRARGTRVDVRVGVGVSRISPACAGNTCVIRILDMALPDQPRAVVVVAGSAPRARGTPNNSEICYESYRISPACAGNTLSRLQP